jgi:LEA14-like dessication related protein
MPLLKEPAVTLDGVKVLALGLGALELEVDLRVANPNIFGVTLRELPFTVSCVAGGNEHQLATGNTGSVKIRRNSSTVLTVPVTVHNAGIIGALTTLVAQGGIEVTVRGTAVIDCIVTCRPVPFTKSVLLTTQQLAESLSGPVAGKKV